MRTVAAHLGMGARCCSVGRWALHLFTYSTFVADSDLDHQRNFNDSYKVFSLTLPNELDLLRREGAVGPAGRPRAPGPRTAW